MFCIDLRSKLTLKRDILVRNFDFYHIFIGFFPFSREYTLKIRALKIKIVLSTQKFDKK